jgi:hypothetical protein
LCVVAFAIGAELIGTGCGKSGTGTRHDAGQQLDVPNPSGGALGTGGSTTASGSGGAASGGTAGTSIAGAGGNVGRGGATTFGSGGVVIGGSGGTRTGGMVGTGGSSKGGTAGTTAGGVGGAITGSGGVVGGAGGTATQDAGGMATGGTGGLDAGQAGTYSGCNYIGGINRAVVAKFDAQTGLCTVLVLASPGGATDAAFGLTITTNWGMETTGLWSSAVDDCAKRPLPTGSVRAIDATGSVTVTPSMRTIDIDAELTFPASDAGPARSVKLKAQGVDINKGC